MVTMFLVCVVGFAIGFATVYAYMNYGGRR